MLGGLFLPLLGNKATVSALQGVRHTVHCGLQDERKTLLDRNTVEMNRIQKDDRISPGPTAVGPEEMFHTNDSNRTISQILQWMRHVAWRP